MEKTTFQKLSPPTPKSTYWKYVESLDKKTAYLMVHRIWTLPMWSFHLLRKLAMFFDSIGDFIRELIHRYEKDLSPKIEIK